MEQFQAMISGQPQHRVSPVFRQTGNLPHGR
jgi:hypothetical protein